MKEELSEVANELIARIGAKVLQVMDEIGGEGGHYPAQVFSQALILAFADLSIKNACALVEASVDAGQKIDPLKRYLKYLLTEIYDSQMKFLDNFKYESKDEVHKMTH